MPPLLTSQDRRKLLAWFRQHQRPMPWRVDRDPYRIWVSEVMLQQTTVATVSKRFAEFINQFPTIHDLAAASEQAVLRQWEGLGYYSRARNLHRSAKILVEQHEGQLPNDPEVWANLPGVGRYILGAVLSQAFDRRLPVVEANTRRVLARLGANQTDLASKSMQDWLWNTASEILPRTNVGDFNQAMMELGSLVCTVKDPECHDCPLNQACLGFQRQIQHELPVIQKKSAVIPLLEVCLIFRNGNEFFLRQRGLDGRWAGMWEFPTLPCPTDRDWPTVVNDFLNSSAMKGDVIGLRHRVKYTVTRYRITALVIEINCAERQPSAYDKEGQWISEQELADYPISSPHRKITKFLTQPPQPGLFE